MKCSVIFNGVRVCVCVCTGGTWWGSRARWWATSPSPSTSQVSSWAACTTLIISLEPCTSALQTSSTCPSSSPSTGPYSAVNPLLHLIPPPHKSPHKSIYRGVMWRKTRLKITEFYSQNVTRSLWTISNDSDTKMHYLIQPVIVV